MLEYQHPLTAFWDVKLGRCMRIEHPTSEREQARDGRREEVKFAVEEVDEMPGSVSDGRMAPWPTCSICTSNFPS